MSIEGIIPPHGGYRKLRSYQVAKVVYDVTLRFCDRYVSRFSRTKEQMIQAARSGVRNIMEGSQASGTSKKIELKLTGIARASLEELLGDYETYLSHNGYAQWPQFDDRQRDLVASRPASADEVAAWVKATALRGLWDHGRDGRHRPDGPGAPSGRAKHDAYAETSANAAITLIVVTNSLLDRQLKALEKAFMKNGGFTEALYRYRKTKKRQELDET